jgi:hypothetical protein
MLKCNKSSVVGLNGPMAVFYSTNDQWLICISRWTNGCIANFDVVHQN